MSLFSSLLNRAFGIPETHVDAATVLSLVEHVAEPQITALAAHLNLDEAKAVSAGAELIKAAADARVSQLSGSA